MKHTNIAIGVKIAEIRDAVGLTQSELAKKINTTQSAVARMETGKQNVSTQMLKKISSALGKNLLTLSPGTVNLQITGGVRMTGEVITNTSKNGAVGLLCAALLNKGTTTFHRMPKIEEVYRLVEVLDSLGVKCLWNNHTLTIIPPKQFIIKNINALAARKTRSIIMFVGALIHSLKKFSLPQSGGCRIGSRTIRPHLFALEHFGVKADFSAESVDVTVSQKIEAEKDVVLYESGDTVTENVLMAAALTPKKTIIKYASANYMVQEMCIFLGICGVVIEGIGTTTLTVHGVKSINLDVNYTLSEDPTDSMFFLAAAIVTKSQIKIKRCPIRFLELELLVLEKMGFKFKQSKEYLSENGATKLVDITTKPSNLKAPSEKIAPRPYPGLNIDNLPFFAVIATQAEGQTLIHDWVYEKRAIYFTELDKLGAHTVLADPHRIYINGKTVLRPAELVCPPALRPATILLIAMLGAKGQSILRNIYSINRGYENLVTRLQLLKADINYLEEF